MKTSLARSDFVSDSSDLEMDCEIKCRPPDRQTSCINKTSDSDDDVIELGLMERIMKNSAPNTFVTDKTNNNMHREILSEIDEGIAFTKRDAILSSQLADACSHLDSDDDLPDIEAVTQAREVNERREAASNCESKRKQTTKEDREKKRAEKQRKKEVESNEKYRAQLERNILRQMKPGECLRLMTVMVDPEVLRCPGAAAILPFLQEQGIRFEVIPQPQSGLVTFWRETAVLQEVADGKASTASKDVVADEVLLFMPLADFLSFVQTSIEVSRGTLSPDSETLQSFVGKVKSHLEERQVIFIVQGMDKHFSRDRGKGSKKTGKAAAATEHLVSRQDVEQILLELQLDLGANIVFVEDDSTLPRMVYQYTKAIAEKPFKVEKHASSAFSFHIDSSGSVKVDREGHGLATLWRKQLQQFRNVSVDVANAIAAEYPSPHSLREAYSKCPSDKERAALLQDIVVRRGAGVMATSRRVGKELSRKLFLFLTSTDPDLVL